MKVIFVALTLLMVVASAFARSTVQVQKAHLFPDDGVGPVCPIDDPLQRDVPLPINITLDPLLKLEEGSIVEGLIVEGLSSLRYRFWMNVLISVEFEFNITTVSGNATFDAPSGYVDARPLRQETIPSGNLTGSGFGKFSATNMYARGSFNMISTIKDKIQLSRLRFDNLSFDSLAVDLGPGFSIGGGAVDWTEWSRNVKSNFDSDFGEHKTEFTDKIRMAVNSVIKNFTLNELVEFFYPDDDEC